jgi:hypothetical protein
MKRNFAFTQSGNLYGITCKTKKAKKWVKENCQTDGWQWLGNTLWIDIRMAETIKEAIQSEFN